MSHNFLPLEMTAGEGRHLGAGSFARDLGGGRGGRHHRRRITVHCFSCLSLAPARGGLRAVHPAKACALLVTAEGRLALMQPRERLVCCDTLCAHVPAESVLRGSQTCTLPKFGPSPRVTSYTDTGKSIIPFCGALAALALLGARDVRVAQHCDAIARGSADAQHCHQG